VAASPTKDKETTMIDLDDFSKRYQDHKKAVSEANSLNKVPVFDALVAGKITRVTIEFDGKGDSGQLNDITHMPCSQIIARMPLALRIDAYLRPEG
jgi:hypothetical protein